MLEADMSRFIDFNKPDFIGREATLRQPARSLAIGEDATLRGPPRPLTLGNDATLQQPPRSLAIRETATLRQPPRPLESGEEATRRGAPRSLKIVYAEVDATDTHARGGDPVLHGDRSIGVITSGAYGHRVRKSLAFACVAQEFAAPGTRFEVLIQGERRAATVLEHAAFDPNNARMRV
jgi:glycine cleavage system aminomethyltransferase T